MKYLGLILLVAAFLAFLTVVAVKMPDVLMAQPHQDQTAEPHDPITVRVLTSNHTDLIGVGLGSEGLALSVTVWLDREEATTLRDRLTEALKK